MKLKQIFGDKRIVALAGNKNAGKTNNLLALIKDFRQHNVSTPIYIYGFNTETTHWVTQFKNIYEISSLEQLTTKTNAIFIIDEFQLLKLNDPRYKDLLNSFVDFIYQKEANNRCILCSPNLREFNSTIGGKVERWLLKSISYSACINGSQLKKVVEDYKGRYKRLKDIVLEPNQLLVINSDKEMIMELEYIKKGDTKADNHDIFKTEIIKKIIKK